ncbi:serine/threonine-protein kinase [Halomonas alkalicola]|uniref:serine/threonine-protein kinase n=1 Tax=Halomonas alkalicola TaxID=1930622 RepID=UPI00265DC606|nr:serine/threonine-protein kinase [Halomonas alkalicola]
MAASFDFKKRLGSGYFGEVWRAVDLGLNSECAVKCIPPDKVLNKSNFYQEAQVLKAAEHENIVAVTEAGSLSDGRVYVVMELLPNGSLEDEAKGGYVPLSRAKRLMIDVLRGLKHAHDCNIVHRDIKPANIMIGNNNEGKLSDFGLALPDLDLLDISAVKGYQYILHLAPEVEKFSQHTALADIYACGVTLYRLVNGDSYLPSVTPSEARRLATKGEFPDRSYYRGFVPAAFKKVINRAMEVDPAARYQSAEEMRRALEKVQISVDWDENVFAGGKQWLGSAGDIRVLVERMKGSDGSWSVTVKKGKEGKNMRRDNSMCSSGLSEGQAMRSAYRVLQRFTSGKVK